MSENVIREVAGIEAEAERIVAEARARADGLLRAADAEVAALGKQLEERLARETAAFRQACEAEAQARMAEMDGRARQIATRLDSMDARASSRAVMFVRERLQGA